MDADGGPAGSAAALSDATAVDPTFDTDIAGSYVAELVVNDGTADSAADTVTITVGNVAPTANAGPDQAGVSQGATVTLDGSGSSDAGGDALTYAWTLTTVPAGSAAVLSSTTAVGPTFDTDIVGNYVAELVVNDGTVDSAPDTVTVTVANVAPTANAGPDQPGVVQGATVTLDGSGFVRSGRRYAHLCVDTDGETGGQRGSTQQCDGRSARRSTPTSPGTYVAELVVNDGTANSAADTVTVTVANVAPTANAGGPYTVDQGETIVLDGSASSDTGGSIVSWDWDINNDGTYGDARGR